MRDPPGIPPSDDVKFSKGSISRQGDSGSVRVSGNVSGSISVGGVVQTGERICRVCGQHNPPDRTFCRACGNRLTGPVDRGEEPRPPGPAPSESDVVASAEAAIGETRRQIDFLVDEANSLDTKAAAIITLTGLASGIVVGRLHLDTAAQQVSAAVAGFVLLLLLVCAWQALRPRGGWSFGANPRVLTELVQSHSHRAVLLALANSLVQARERDAMVLRRKQVWYERGLRGIVATLLAIGLMIQTGAIR